MSQPEETPAEWSKFRERCHHIIFYSTKPAEKLFDLLLILAITFSVITVMLESVASIRAQYGSILYSVEWTFTILFTMEYALRIYVSKKPLRYIYSPFGIVDLVSILPTYLDLLFPGAHYLMLIRSLRVLRIFRVLKMVKFVGEQTIIYQALLASSKKVVVFVLGVLTLVIIFGSVMYLIEGPEHGFTSIPRSMYWAIVTLTTVGYGDISPQTPLGQMLASMIMILGYGIIAVPTGIVTAELALASNRRKPSICGKCGERDHRATAKYCRQCGEPLD